MSHEFQVVSLLYERDLFLKYHGFRPEIGNPEPQHLKAVGDAFCMTSRGKHFVYLAVEKCEDINNAAKVSELEWRRTTELSLKKYLIGRGDQNFLICVDDGVTTRELGEI